MSRPDDHIGDVLARRVAQVETVDPHCRRVRRRAARRANHCAQANASSTFAREKPVALRSPERQRAWRSPATRRRRRTRSREIVRGQARRFPPGSGSCGLPSRAATPNQCAAQSVSLPGRARPDFAGCAQAPARSGPPPLLRYWLDLVGPRLTAREVAQAAHDEAGCFVLPSRRARWQPIPCRGIAPSTPGTPTAGTPRCRKTRCPDTPSPPYIILHTRSPSLSGGMASVARLGGGQEFFVGREGLDLFPLVHALALDRHVLRKDHPEVEVFLLK